MAGDNLHFKQQATKNAAEAAVGQPGGAHVL
jgi:hypothetical protein